MGLRFGDFPVWRSIEGDRLERRKDMAAGFFESWVFVFLLYVFMAKILSLENVWLRRAVKHGSFVGR